MKFLFKFYQEILVYLAMIARTHPQDLQNILRIRIGLIIQMMASELARSLGFYVDDSLYTLFSMRPIDTKRLLQNLLRGREIRMAKPSKSDCTLGIILILKIFNDHFLVLVELKYFTIDF